MSKVSLIIFFLSFCLVGIGMIYPQYEIHAAHIIMRLSGLFIVMEAGTFYQTRLFKLLGLSAAIICVGALFKIQHYPGASLMLVSGMLSIVVFYLIHFLKKKSKGVQDYLKMLFVTLMPVGVLFKILHVPYALELGLFTTVFLIYLVVTQVVKGRK